MASNPNRAPSISIPLQSAELFQRALNFQAELIDYFAGGKSLGESHYQAMRKELLEDSRYGNLAPSWLRRNRDLGALWSFAKSIDGSWEPRRQFVREQFEPLLDFLERGGGEPSPQMPGPYDASAWTGVQSAAQQAQAIKTLIPVAQAAVGSLIEHLEKPNHNGGPPLDEVEFALERLRKLYSALGSLLTAVEGGKLRDTIDNGLVAEVARYGRQAARALKNDPLPYALSGTLLALFTACGFPGLGGYLGGIAIAIKKPGQGGGVE
ncbi:hypothetical protein SAMN06295912_11863 [Sphingomonas laterariae]|uniref:Uncharacterized protein n=1 Tax=Edaphosphingomonas laterariae TaxID=861865 RepID=A0A239HQ71_9SPHN|nr:hypothetical protein [Sphingomonas laterariae]SNS83489.1 hypothetical protein SAMN06295912_11863 [Sphingomonas laterariae]